MKLLKKCIIEGCEDEVRFTTKSCGKLYNSCKRHEREVTQIVATEHSKKEVERFKQQRLFHLTKVENPEWMKI